MRARSFFSLGFVLAVGLSPLPALAQKAKDTLRIGVYQPISIVDSIYDPQPQTDLITRSVFDTLVQYDAHKRQILPGLAESWTFVDDKTIEFKLRQGVKFQDGSDFDADDVVYTINFVMDPASKFRFKEARFGLFESVEKVDQYTVRLKLKQPFAPILARLTTTLPIYPSDVHSKLADKALFGRNPIGTGPYKVTMVDPSKGVVLEKNPYFKEVNLGQPAGKIGRIVIAPVPDQQTQLAKMMIGDQDLMYDVPSDIAGMMQSNPAIEISVRPSVSFTYLMLDAADRSGFGKFKDIRVREAMFRAIDRKALVNALQPKDIAALPLQQAMCPPQIMGCASSIDPPGYDLAKAKQLLKEAGQPDGFNLTITTWGAAQPVAEAVAGQLRKVGINASIDTLTSTGFVTKRAAGQLQAFIVLWDNGGGSPDVESTVNFMYEKGDRNYNQDPQLEDLQKQSQTEMDPKKREALLKRIFDRATSERYSMPITPLASVIAHSAEVKIPTGGTLKPEGFLFNLLAWK
ncbi:ABC transporter substrate-binding protein [Methylocella sp. CPCC 101449]|uniref:ABC transporter substrate-binding protein n=1 Tax=Methylocella sp. CPCC 101449 TaxID=2987531 RepID=UPI00288F55AD|nr:ABC transporter substrate-binding protein [Methylocella sp. CPCC 101449]MDT2021082.1 ABC transporter substrate-binding protein [Methylocella sp. CPCC 101449]